MKRFLVLLTIVAFVPGCDVIPFWPSGPEPTTVGKGDSSLKGFRSADELNEYFSQQVMEQNERYSFGAWGMAADGQGGGGFDRDEGMDISAPTSGAAPAPEAGEDEANNGDVTSELGGEDHSGTTVQETGVDEADVVKTDGTYLYAITGGTLHIVQILPVEEMVELPEVALEGDGLDLYLHGDTIVALTATYGGFVYDYDGVSDGGGVNWETAVDSEEVGGDAGDEEPGLDGEEDADPDDQDPPSKPDDDSPDGPVVGPEPDADDNPADEPKDDPDDEPQPDADDEPIVEPEPVPMPDEPPFVPGEYERPGRRQS